MFKKIKSFLFENKGARQTVAKNTTWLTISNFGGRMIKAVIILYAARVLSTAGYGVFSYAVTLAGFFTLFLDPGVNATLMREASKTDEEGRRIYLSTTLFMKLIIVISGVLFVTIVAPIFSTLPGSKELLPFVALIISADTFREFFSSFMRAQEKMEWDAGIFLFTNVALVVAGFIAFSISKTPASFAIAYAAGSMAGVLLSIWVVRKHLVGIRQYFSTKLVRPIIRSAWPFAITGALGSLFTSADIIIISWFKTASDVGIYSAAVRIVQVLYVIPMIFQYSTLPLIARLANKDNERFRAIFERTLGVVLMASVPLALGGIVLGTPIMSLVFGAPYAPGGLSFKILMATMIFDFPLAIVSTAMFAYDRQKSLINSSIIGGTLNVALDLAFIPMFGMAGSAVATLIAQAGSNWYLWSTMKKINYFTILGRIKNILLAGALMGLATFIFAATGMNLIANVGVSALLYVVLLLALREPLLLEFRKTLSAPAQVA